MFKRERTYFIAYSSSGGFGNCTIKRKKITSESDIAEIEKELSNHFKRDVSVIWWHLWK